MKKKTGIILAFDQSAFEEQDRLLLQELAPLLSHVKVGLESMTAEHPVSRRTIASLVLEFCKDILGLGVMWDMKIHDIGNTMEKASKNIVKSGAHFFTLHAMASENALTSVAKVGKVSNTVPLAVTVLTDLDDAQCISRFRSKSKDAVRSFATNACNRGIPGIVCSPHELPIIRDTEATNEAMTVIPGIRPEWAGSNDQKRVMTPAEAVRAGADHIVVGRPILQPPPGLTPLGAAKLIFDELEAA